MSTPRCPPNLASTQAFQRRSLLKGLQENETAFVVVERAPTFVAARCHVVKRPLKLDANGLCDGSVFSDPTLGVKCQESTP